MIVEVDFNSDEAIYIQLRNQIIVGIACDEFREGDCLPSVRQMADEIGINMHTVNKAYSVLRQEGFIKLDRRRGAVVDVDPDKKRMLDLIRHDLGVLLAAGSCKNITRNIESKTRQSIANCLLDDFSRYRFPIVSVDNLRRHRRMGRHVKSGILHEAAIGPDHIVISRNPVDRNVF